MKSTASSRGFTLVELLVVISIIAVLAAVVLSSLSVARTKAFDAKFYQGIVQVRNALALYRSNNNDYPPLGNTTKTIGWDWPSPGTTLGTDNKGISNLDSIIWAGLISGNYLSAIPHYNGWASGSGVDTNPATWISYFKNATQIVNGEYYYNCSAFTSPSSIVGNAMIIIGYSGLFRIFSGNTSFFGCRSNAAGDACQNGTYGSYSYDNTVSDNTTHLVCIPLI